MRRVLAVLIGVKLVVGQSGGKCRALRHTQTVVN